MFNIIDPTQFVFDRSKLPTAPKSVLKSDIDLELVPKVKPFRAFLGNISFEADEEKLKSFFKDLKVLTAHLTTDQGGRSKGSGYIDFDDRDSLIAALNKNENVFLNRPLRISLSDSSRGGYDRTGGYGERGSNFRQQSQDSGPLRSDESTWRREPEPSEPAPYQERSGYQSNRYQSSQFQSTGTSSSGGGYQQRRFQDRQQGTQQGSYQDRQGSSSYQDRRNRTEDDGQQRQQRRPYSNYPQKQYGSFSREEPEQTSHEIEKAQSPAFTQSPQQAIQSPTTSITEVKERPKLNLIPRTLPVEPVEANAPTSSIFGGAKPVNTAARELEIEARLKEREKLDKEKLVTGEETDTTDAKPTRSQKTSVTSDDAQHIRHEEKQSKAAHHNKHDNNNNNSNNNNNRNHSFTSPSSQHQQNRQHNQSDTHRPSENPWQKRNASDLFANSEKAQSESSDSNRNYNNNTSNDRRTYNNSDDRRQFNKRPDSSQQQQQTRTYQNRDNKQDNRRGSGLDRGGGKQM